MPFKGEKIVIEKGTDVWMNTKREDCFSTACRIIWS